ncbi:MAG: aminopeptidase N [Nitriliruptoraceae bacterium]
MTVTANLTQREAEARAALLAVPRTVVALDLSDGDRDVRTFRARVELHLVVRAAGDAFVDHLAAEVHAATLDGRPLPGDAIAPTRILLQGLTPGDHVLAVEATMSYTRDGRGLHRFVDPTDGVVYLHSQLEPFHAHQVFPCLDQPDLKTAFELTVDAPAGWVVVSNEAPTAAPAPGDAGRWEFPPTPPMSTYLAAVIAGGYSGRTAEHVRPDGSAVPLGLYVRRSLERHLDGDELLDLTRAGLDWFEDVFGRYPYAKYDQLLVPEFSAGAMENPGAVTFSENYVFRSRVTDALRERRAETLLHEMAHMWFGDLVTMRWWDDLWLNESFATFMAVLSQTEATRWTDAWVTFLDAEKTWAKFQDQLPSTHPIAADMPDVESVHQNFDGITYAKGASVLRQLVAWVGQDAFLAGCRDYFERHAWGNTTLADFLGALERASGRDLGPWADEWLRTTGVNTLEPVVELAPDGTYARVAIRQADPAPLWRTEGHVPVLRRHRLAVGCYAWRDGVLRRVHREELDVVGELTEIPALTGLPAADLLLLNDDDLTFARTVLDPASLATATDHLRDVEPALPRALVWATAWDMVRDAELPASGFVELVVNNLAHDEQVGVVQRILGRAQAAAERYADREHAPGLRRMLREQALTARERCAAGGDHQLAWFKQWSALVEDGDDLAVLQACLGDAVPFEGLVVDTDLRWHVVVQLARVGAAGADEIAAERRRDDTDLGERQALTALAVRPTPEAKAEAWERLLEDADLSHTLARQLWGGFDRLDRPELLAPYRDRYFAVLDRVWAERSLDFAIEFAGATFPHSQVEAGLLEATDAALTRADLPRPLRRVLLEQRDTVVRTLRCRARDAA